jgi:hypothetical protein
MTDREAKNKSESELLREEAQLASEAIRQTLRSMQGDVKEAADVAAWTREYPWASIGVAAAAGFLAASALAPGGRRTRRRSRDPFYDEVESWDGRPRRRRRSTSQLLMGKGVRMLLNAFQTSLVAALTAHFKPAPEPPQEAEPHTNGRHTAEAEV